MCDTLCSVQPGRTLFAKNSDRPLAEVQLVESFGRRAGGGELHTQYLTLPDPGAVAVLGARPAWLWGFEHGVNEHRVAIGNEKLFTALDPATVEPALIGMDLVRLGLERATSADDALELITTLLAQHGQGGVADQTTDDAYFSSFLLADPLGGWVLETSGRSWAARPVEGGAAISNRISLSTDWTRASGDLAPGDDWDRFRDPEAWLGLADKRLECTMPVAAARDPLPSARDLAAALRHHGTRSWGEPGGPGADVEGLPHPDLGADGTGVTVCFHIRGFQATTSSLIAELPASPDEPLRAWVAPGAPCVSVFVPVFPPDPTPPELAREATWRRFAALRAQVEGPVSTFDDPIPWDGEASTARLAEVRAALAPIEAELWDEADDLVISSAADDPARRAAFVASAGPRVDAALSHLGV